MNNIDKLRTISTADSKWMESHKNSHPINKFFKNKENFKFRVGDILVCKNLSYDIKTDEDVWKIKTVSSRSKVPKRYVYLMENEIGMGYVRSVKVNGETGSELFCLHDIDPEITQFELDQDYMDHLLLAQDGDDLDLTQLHKIDVDRRKKIRDANKQKLIKFNSVKKAQAFIPTLKVGQTIYLCHGRTTSISNPDSIERIITEVGTVALKDIKPDYYYRSDKINIRYKEEYSKSSIDVVHYFKCKSISGYADTAVTCENLSFDLYSIYLEKPLAITEATL